MSVCIKTENMILHCKTEKMILQQNREDDGKLMASPYHSTNDNKATMILFHNTNFFASFKKKKPNV